eukprot:UN3732
MVLCSPRRGQRVSQLISERTVEALRKRALTPTALSALWPRRRRTRISRSTPSLAASSPCLHHAGSSCRSASAASASASLVAASPGPGSFDCCEAHRQWTIVLMDGRCPSQVSMRKVFARFASFFGPLSDHVKEQVCAVVREEASNRRAHKVGAASPYQGHKKRKM